MATSLQFLAHPWKLVSSLWSGPADVITPATLSALPGVTGSTGAPGGISAAANVLATAPDQSLVPQGLCGWVPSEVGGSSNFVCQAMGQVMPGVVFLVSMLVITATVFFLLRYLSRTSALVSELEKLSAALEKVTASGADEWAKAENCEKVLSEIARSGEKFPPLQEFAKKVRSSLAPFPTAENNRVALKEPASALAAQVLKSERWSGQSLAEALPGWLTAIGLLTTFIAILLGLKGVKVLANLEVHGIGGLVNGLSAKFFSSIISLGCAISITITQYFIAGSLQARWAHLADRLQILIPHMSIERIFLELARSRKTER